VAAHLDDLPVVEDDDEVPPWAGRSVHLDHTDQGCRLQLVAAHCQPDADSFEPCLKSGRHSENVRRGRQREARVGEAKPVEPFDHESGVPDCRGGVPAGVTTTADGGPDGGVEHPLDSCQRRRVGSDVLEEAQLPAGPDDAVHLAERRLLVSDRAQHERDDGGIEGRVVGR